MSDSWNPLSSVARYVRRYLYPAVSDPEGSRKRLKMSCTSPLLGLTPDLILRIASLLEIRDVLSLGMCNKFLYDISQDENLWRGLLRNLCLPRTLRSRLLDLSYPKLREAAMHLFVVEGRWLKQHHIRAHPLKDERSRSRLLRFLDDRWIIAFPEIGPPTIWDAQEKNPEPYRLHESMRHVFEREVGGTEVAVDPLQGDIIIALQESPPRRTLRILRVHLADPRTDGLQLTAYRPIENLNSGVIALEPSRNAVITGERGEMQISDWIRNRTAQVIDPHVPGDFGPDLGARLVGDYILYLRSGCIELLSAPPFPDANGQTHETDPAFDRFQLNFGTTRFSGASLSEAQPNPKSPNDSVVVYVLAYRETFGFFYFRVTIYNPRYVPSGPRPGVDVDILGLFDPKEYHIAPEPTRVTDAWLGPQGRRGLWMEQPVGDVPAKYYIGAVSFDQNPSETVAVKPGDELEELHKIAPRIESVGAVLDTGCEDNTTRCDFSEATGEIVLDLGNVDLLSLLR